MRRMLIVVCTLLFALAPAVPASAQPTIGDDDLVTGQAWVRHDGGSDAAIDHCNDQSTDEAPDDDPDDGDSDSNDGGSRRQNNEPFSVVDPTNPEVIVAGWNDYCLTDLGAGWQGFGFSLDGGDSWTNSFVPGYPQDTSVEGMASPLFGRHTEAGDPIAAFDSDGNLFVGGISFNRAGAINGDVYVATYGAADQPNGYPVDYLRTRIVGQGTPSRNFQGIFQDKPMLEVDRTGGDHDGNVYVCWSRFTGFGQNKVFFSRSTDMGETFSRPIAISRTNEIKSVQGCDIAVESDGDVYTTFRTFAGGNKPTGLAFARSTDGGQSFSKAELIRPITPYFPFDGFRDCGDGGFVCQSEFVFARIPLEPRVTADQTGELEGVHLVYNEINPDSVEPSETSYSSAGAGTVGQSLLYVVSTLDDGASWSEPTAVDPAEAGHQFFPDVDALAGSLAVVWQDSRTDPCYSVQLPIGNTADATSCGTDIVNTFVAVSSDGATFEAVLASDEAHQPMYEMFGNRDIPFQGDYNWISLAEREDESLFGYFTWTDNRDVVEGEDPREAEQDGFDVWQCREELDDGSFGPDTCANAGGLDQNIYGNSLEITP
ncbi:MAG TPA: sialidase family protein [Actinomycetota bacterium]